MEVIYFIIRHTPFWAIPIMIIGGEFAYIFWIKNKKNKVRMLAILIAICIVALIYYYWSGGPEHSVKKLIKLLLKLDLIRGNEYEI